MHNGSWDCTLPCYTVAVGTPVYCVYHGIRECPYLHACMRFPCDAQAASGTIENKHMATIYTLHAIYMRSISACTHVHAVLVVSSVYKDIGV